MQQPEDLIPFGLADKGNMGKLKIRTRKRFLIKKTVFHGLSYQRMGSTIL